jgi:hypothetical protein
MKKLVPTLLVLFLCSVAVAEDTGDQTHPPSTPEILELAAKAKEKAEAFRAAIVAAKEDLPPDLYSQDIEAANTADVCINLVRSTGSAYSIVALVTILDDLTLDASRAETQLAMRLATQPPPTVQNRLALETMTIDSAQNGCFDISELTMHAALRYVGYEESSLGKLIDAIGKKHK